MEHARKLAAYGAGMSAQSEQDVPVCEKSATAPKKNYFHISFRDIRNKSDHTIEVPADTLEEALTKAEKLLIKKEADPDTMKIHSSAEFQKLGAMSTFYVYYSHYEGERFCKISVPFDGNFNQTQQKARAELFKRLGKMPTKVIEERYFKQMHRPRLNRFQFFYKDTNSLFMRKIQSVVIEAPNAIDALILFRQKYGRQPISWEYA